MENGYSLELDTVSKIVRIQDWYFWNQKNEIASIRFDFDITKQTLLEIFLSKDILEVFVDKKRSIVTRLLKNEDGGLCIKAEEGNVKFDFFKISEI